MLSDVLARFPGRLWS